MNTDKLIPIDFSRNITPLVIGDMLYSSVIKWEFPLTNDGLNEINTNTDNSFLYVVSFADRQNTGTQPVADDVVVDFTHNSECGYTQPAGKGDRCMHWGNGMALGHIASWKPNHAAMLAKFKEQGANNMNTDSKNNHIATTIEALGSQPVHHIDLAVTAGAVQDIVDAADPGYAPDCPGGASKPIYTQAMSDAGELPTIGCKCIVTIEQNGIPEGREVFIGGHANFGADQDVAVYNDGLNVGTAIAGCFKPIDSRTDEEKLRDAIYDAANGLTLGGSLIESLLASDKFTITLKDK